MYVKNDQLGLTWDDVNSFVTTAANTYTNIEKQRNEQKLQMQRLRAQAAGNYPTGYNAYASSSPYSVAPTAPINWTLVAFMTAIIAVPAFLMFKEHQRKNSPARRK